MISFFASAMAVEPDSILELPAFFEFVKTGKWQFPVSAARIHLKNGNRDAYDKTKRKLPCVSISGACISRAHDLTLEEKAFTHSGWLQADFDGKDNALLDDQEFLAETRQKLLDCPHVGGVFIGPSSQGIKAVVRIDPERHRESWFAAEKFFKDGFGLSLDKSTKDPLRLCFVSYDENAVWKSSEVSPLPILEVLPEGSKKQSDFSSSSDTETTAADIAELLRFIPTRPEYSEWLRIASAVWSILPMGEGCAVLNTWSPEEKEGEYATKFNKRLTQVGIGTLVYMASLNGFDAREAYRKKRWAGRIRFASGIAAPAYEDTKHDLSPKNITSETELSRERVMLAVRDGQAGDARLWADLRRGLRVFHIQWDCWLIYSDGVWRKDDANLSIIDISESLRRIYDAMIASVAVEAKQDDRKSIKDDLRLLEERRKKLCILSYIRDVAKLAASDLHVFAKNLDSHPHLLCVENGTLDFNEGILREHRAADFLTHKTPIAFDPQSDCSKWNEFLAMFLGSDDELVGYLARAVGYSLTAKVNEDALFFCYGSGANGKSTFFSALQILLGQMMTTVPIASLLYGMSDNTCDYHKSSMEGKRLVVTDEVPANRRLAENQIKALVGGDDIVARRPYEKPYTFKPTHKLWLCGNHKPSISGTDHGIWRRIHLIPWAIRVSDEKKRNRHDVLDEFFAERSGILNWAIRGLLDYQTRGSLDAPLSVVNATKEYRSDNDQLANFMEERCLVSDPEEGVWSKLKDILHSYKSWCEENGEKVNFPSSQKLKIRLVEAGFSVVIGGGDHTNMVKNLSLKPLENDSPIRFSNTQKEGTLWS